MDVKSAFLNGDLENEIFMRIPPGVEAKKEEQVWSLHKAFYGLKQASRERYLKLKGQLEELGFKRSNADHGVFTKIIDGKLFLIAIYVDDFLLFLSNIGTVNKRHFEMKDLEEASWILQMKIERLDMRLGVRTLSISQEQYILAILKWHRMTNSNPVKAPMIANLQLPSLIEAEINIMEYQKCTGSLMYLMVCTRPDIAYAVGVLLCHVACPGNVHMQAVILHTSD